VRCWDFLPAPELLMSQRHSFQCWVFSADQEQILSFGDTHSTNVPGESEEETGAIPKFCLIPARPCTFDFRLSSREIVTSRKGPIQGFVDLPSLTPSDQVISA
jgi:hypothetical protein